MAERTVIQRLQLLVDCKCWMRVPILLTLEESLLDLVGGRLPGRTVDEALLDARLVKAHLRVGG